MLFKIGTPSGVCILKDGLSESTVREFDNFGPVDLKENRIYGNEFHGNRFQGNRL